MIAHFWWGATLGVFVGHSEVVLQLGVEDDDQVMWWSKGGSLRGDSPPRMKFFKQYMQRFTARVPFSAMITIEDTLPMTGCNGSALVYPGLSALFYLLPQAARVSTLCNLTLPGLATNDTFSV